jgi:hypothetical protein
MNFRFSIMYVINKLFAFSSTFSFLVFQYKYPLNIILNLFSLICVRMKWIVYIFSFYLISLTIVPCSDGLNMTHSAKNELTTTHDHNSEHSDLCTPFCSCNCCRTHVNIENASTIYEFHQSIAFLEKDFSNTEFEFTSNYSGSFWHPPQNIS